LITEGFAEALRLLVSGDPELLRIVGLSLLVSCSAVGAAMVLGVPLGVLLGQRRFPGRSLIITIVNTGMGLPPVAVGLFVFLLLARSGPLGEWELLYTPWAMIFAQILLATPLVVGVTMSGIQSLDENLHLQIRSLGASRWQYYRKLVREARLTLAAALAAGFGAAISEVGAVMMTGGNIKGQTRVLTTAIVLETRQGNYAMAIALSLILLALAALLNLLFTVVQQRRAS
jgi:tungstate transport system permease protein